MKNIFGINKEKDSIDGMFYLDRSLSDELSKEVIESQKELDDVNKKVVLPKYFKITIYASFLYLFLVLIKVCGQMDNKIPFIDIIKSNLILLIISVVVIIVLIVLHLYYKKRCNKIVESDETKSLVNKTEDLYNRCLEDLKIPAIFSEVNVLCYLYEEKDGKVKIQKNAGIGYIALECKIFEEDNCLCLADLETVLKIPYDEITKIIKLKKRHSFINWTKEEQPKNNKYNGYKVVVQNNLIYTVTCYQIIINSSFGEYEILIPEYEHDSIVKLLNLEICEE